MIEDPLVLLTSIIWLAALGTWPVAFLFGACSTCCQTKCGFVLAYERCMRIARVGDPTPGMRGTHKRVLLRGNGGSGIFQTVSGDGLTVANAPTEARIPVRVSLSASGNSRTAPGQTRSQVWRFKVTPTPLADSVPPTADIEGPPWYLQVDVNVQGIVTTADVVDDYSEFGSTVQEISDALAENEQALAAFQAALAAAEMPGVDAAVATDEHGQTKLVLNVKQGPDTITYEREIILSLVGYQRWQFPGTVLTSSTLNATLEDGPSVSGWLVSKPAGVCASARELAVRIENHFASFGFGTSRYLFDKDAALEFLNGDRPERVPIQGTTYAFDADYQMFPDSVLCGVSVDNLRAGIALDVYPIEISITFEPANITIPAGTFLTPHPSTCSEKFLIHASQQTFLDVSTGLSLDKWGARANPSDFWDGESLLWAIENDPYRTSYTVSGTSAHQITLSLDTAGGSYFGRDTNHPLAVATVTLRATMRVETADIDETADVESVYYWPLFQFLNENDPRFANRILPIGSDLDFFTDFPASRSYSHGLVHPAGFGVGVSMALQATLDKPSAPALDGFHYLSCFGGQINVTVTAAGGADPLTGPIFSFGGFQIGTYTLTNITVEVGQPDRVDARPRADLTAVGSCAPWSPVGAEGGTSTRTCSSGTTTITIPANTSRLPLYQTRGGIAPPFAGTGPGFKDSGHPSFAGAGFIQPGSCSLLGIIAVDDATTSPAVLASPFFVAMNEGECRYFATRFTGSTSFLSCGSCQPALSIVSGDEFATVRIVPSGDRKDLIEIVALKTWDSGEGVTFTVSCGADTFTQVIQRS